MIRPACERHPRISPTHTYPSAFQAYFLRQLSISRVTSIWRKHRVIGSRSHTGTIVASIVSPRTQFYLSLSLFLRFLPFTSFLTRMFLFSHHEYIYLVAVARFLSEITSCATINRSTNQPMSQLTTVGKCHLNPSPTPTATQSVPLVL